MKPGVLLAVLGFCVTLAQAAVLEVVTDDSLPPFSFVQNKVAVGIDVDMLKEAAKEAGVNVSVQALPWKRALKVVELGAAHLGMPLFRNAERERFAVFIAPVHFSTTGLFVRKAGDLAFNVIEDLNGRMLGYNRGYALPDELSAAISTGRVRVEEVGSTEQNVLKLMSGRLDGFVANTLNTLFVLQGRSEADAIVLQPRPLSQRRPAFLVASQAAHWPERERQVAALKAALERMHQDGTYDRIVSRYVQRAAVSP